MVKKLELIGAMYPWMENIRNLRDELSKQSNEDLEIDINSPGGIITLGIELFNRVKRYPGNVKMNIMGQAASMATYFALAGDEVVVEENSIFMIHNAQGISFGDYKEMQKMTNLLDAMTNLIALKYVEKTGKSMKDIRSKMDDETYFFGQDIKDFGFADTVLKSDKKITKAEAEANSLIEITSCIDEMKKHEIDNTDMDKIAAHLDFEKQTHNSAQSAATPDKGNIKPKEDKTMSLKELMAKDPGIKAEVEALMKTEHDKGFTAGRENVQARIKSASPYIGKTEYPEAITNLAVGVVKGEKDPTALEGAVVAFDAMKQQAESEAAQDENEDDTPPEGQKTDINEDGSVSNEAEYQASIAKAKGGA